ncbi:uncharacterized protein KZ484_023567 [Pholidichthys leucotaenia]
MDSDRVVPTSQSRLQRVAKWIDPESAAVVTILLGVFQMMLSAPFFYTGQSLPKLFILPIVIGLVFVTGGSFTMANERSPSMLVLQGCIYSNSIGLVGALLAFCVYCYNLSTAHSDWQCPNKDNLDCPPQNYAAFSWSVSLLLLIFDAVAVFMHSLLSVCALKTLRTQ